MSGKKQHKSFFGRNVLQRGAIAPPASISSLTLRNVLKLSSKHYTAWYLYI